jgi:hypothetical protein
MHDHDVSGRPVQDRSAGQRRQAPRRRAGGPRPVRPAVGTVGVRPAEAERPRVRSGVHLRPELRTPGVRLLVRGAVVAPPARPDGPRPDELRSYELRSSELRSGGVRSVGVRRDGVAAGAARPGGVACGGVRHGVVRRALAGLLLTVAAGAFVFGLGALADVATAARSAEVVAPVSGGAVREAAVTVGVERTPWEVARRVAPAASGPELAALAERIVTDNVLGPVPLRPGQVLTVTVG